MINRSYYGREFPHRTGALCCCDDFLCVALVFFKSEAKAQVTLRDTWDVSKERTVIDDFQHRRNVTWKALIVLLPSGCLAFLVANDVPSFLNQYKNIVQIGAIGVFAAAWVILMYVFFFYYSCPFCGTTIAINKKIVDLDPTRCRVCNIRLK